MPETFRGSINVDIRDSEPDWSPFEPARAPAGAPNVVYIVLDDVGFSAMSCYGGPIETPNIDRIAEAGVRYTQWHTTALCSPTRSCLLTGRNHTRNSMACITEAAIGFPNASGTIPPENGMLSEILGERGWNTYMVGKWHLCPTDEMNLASTRRNWPSGRGFERWYGFLGAETNQWYPDLVYDNHLVDQPRSPEEGYHLTDDLTDKALEFIDDAKAIVPEKPFFLYYAPGACHAPHHAPKEWIDKFKGRFDVGYEAMREQTLARQKELGIVPADTELPPINPIGTPETRTGPDGMPFPPLDYTRPVGVAQRGRETPVRPDGRGVRRIPGPRRLPHRPAARLPGAERRAGQHPDRGGLRQRGQRGGRPERLGQRDEVRQRHRRRPGPKPGPDRRAGRPSHLQPLPDRVGHGLQHPVQDVEALRVQRRDLRPVHHLLAGRAPRPEARSATSTTTPSTSSRPSWTCSASRHPRPSRVTSSRPSTGSACGPASTTRPRPSPRKTQFYSMLGSRSIWHEGWKAVTTHPTIAGWGHFNDDEWELYHTDVDRAETHNLAAEHPDKLRELVNLWFSEAGANGAFPLDDRSAVEIMNTPRPQLTAPRNRYVYRPGDGPGPRVASGQHPGPVFRHRGPGRHSRPRSRRCALRHRVALRRPRPVREEQPAALRQQLRRQRGTERSSAPRTYRPGTT